MKGMDLHRCGCADHIFNSDEKHTMFLRLNVFFNLVTSTVAYRKTKHKILKPTL